MYVILAGDLVSGFTVHGPFHTSTEAISWGVNNLPDSGLWQEMEVEHPADYNEEELPPADGEVTALTKEEIEEYLKHTKEDKLPKEIMIDLSAVS